MQQTIMPVIVFTPPNGKQEYKELYIDDPTCILPKILEILTSYQCRITVEILRLGGLSLCIEEWDFGDFDCELCGNTEAEISTAMMKLLTRFDIKEFNKWKKQMEK